MRPHQGEVGPPYVKHGHVKSNTNWPPHGQPTGRALNCLPTLPFPIPFNAYIVPSTKDIPSTSCLVKTLENGHNREAANLNLFDHPLPNPLGINNELVPYRMFNLGLMPLYVVEHFIIALNPNGPKRDASNEELNFNLFAISWEAFPENSFLPFKTIKIVRSNPTKFMHDKRGPLPCPPSLNATPNYVFDGFARTVLGRQKGHCLEMEANAMQVLHSLTATALCRMDHMNAASFLDWSRSHTWGQ